MNTRSIGLPRSPLLRFDLDMELVPALTKRCDRVHSAELPRGLRLSLVLAHRRPRDAVSTV